MLDQYVEVIKSLNSREVKYVIIGGTAAIVHGVPRMTFDLDILIEATPENASLLLDAFLDARLGTALLTTPEALLSKEITIFNDRVRIDVQTSTPGLTFAEAWSRREILTFEGVDFPIASRPDIIASKRAAGRPIDLDDVKSLEAGDDSQSSPDVSNP
jgi:predicted nucleotidyltransferase